MSETHSSTGVLARGLECCQVLDSLQLCEHLITQSSFRNQRSERLKVLGLEGVLDETDFRKYGSFGFNGCFFPLCVVN